MRVKSLVSLFLVISAVAGIGTSSLGSEYVTNGSNPKLKFVPKDIQWSKKAIQAAKKAEDHVSKELLTELASLRTNGSVRVKKEYIQGSSSTMPKDWSEYVPDARLYRLVGYSPEGRKTSESMILPVEANSLAARLVTINQDDCWLESFSIWDFSTWFKNQCEVTKDKEAVFLRAELRSQLDLMSGSLDLASFPKTQLETCFLNKFPFSIAADKLTCPGLANFFGPQTQVYLNYTEQWGGYSIRVDSANRKYQIKYQIPNFYKIASNTRWNSTFGWISFSPNFN